VGWCGGVCVLGGVLLAGCVGCGGRWGCGGGKKFSQRGKKSEKIEIKNNVP